MAARQAGGRRAGRAPNQRQLRVGEEIRHLLAATFARGDLRDPGLQGRTITVTEVRISPDLKNATAYVVPLGGEHEAEIMVALRRSAPHLRGLVGHELHLRHAPQIGFELDRTFDNAGRIEALLRRPDILRDLEAGTGLAAEE